MCVYYICICTYMHARSHMHTQILKNCPEFVTTICYSQRYRESIWGGGAGGGVPTNMCFVNISLQLIKTAICHKDIFCQLLDISKLTCRSRYGGYTNHADLWVLHTQTQSCICPVLWVFVVCLAGYGI